ncbi:MAG TPA: hypothetical protein VNB06_10280 [Thermoanaerobaculia bacterium]|nr:hypothetical protein [Thermoanaerobaculia bacterium]
MSLFDDEPALLRLAAQVTATTGAPVVGGIAVFLHGYRRTTEDVDLWAADPTAVGEALRRSGARWDAGRREHLLDGVAIHLVTASEASAPASTERIRDVLVVSLPDLVRMKLAAGLDRLERAKDLADVVELIRRRPLDGSFAAALPRSQRAAFRKLCRAVRADDRAQRS